MSDIFKDLVVCRRKDCEYYCTLKQNNCEILRKVYKNDFKCKFYKEKKLNKGESNGVHED